MCVVLCCVCLVICSMRLTRMHAHPRLGFPFAGKEGRKERERETEIRRNGGSIGLQSAARRREESEWRMYRRPLFVSVLCKKSYIDAKGNPKRESLSFPLSLSLSLSSHHATRRRPCNSSWRHWPCQKTSISLGQCGYTYVHTYKCRVVVVTVQYLLCCEKKIRHSLWASRIVPLLMKSGWRR